jgi:hypothetical protein
MANISNHSFAVDESLVQWVLLKNPDHFSKILNSDLGRCLGTEITTEHGRLDFIFESGKNGLMLIELETSIDSTSKLDHCTNQIKRYLNLKNKFPKKEVRVVLVYAKEGTSEHFQKRLSEFSKNFNVILKNYSMFKLIQIYDEMLNRLNRTSGVSLGRAVALGITSITWLNKFIFLFVDGQRYPRPVDSLTWKELKEKFSSGTNFYVLKRFAEDFELFQVKTHNRNREFVLTEYGKRFRDELATKIQINNENEKSELNPNKALTTSQKQLLMEILLNGNFTKIKVNIFHFLRFVHITEGNWLPKTSSKLTKAEQQFLNNMFRTSYNSRTLKDIVQQTCTFCEELGLIERLSMPNQVYDKLMFTSLGSRVYNYFEQLLNVERERYQIPLQINRD